MLISEKVSITVDHIRTELGAALRQMASYVEAIEKRPGEIEVSALDDIMLFSEVCQASMKELSKYSMFFGDIAETINTTDDTIELLADRFLDRARLPGLPVSTAQAMEHFDRSRSTIYRWIKSGKLKAEKQGRRWVVFI